LAVYTFEIWFLFLVIGLGFLGGFMAGMLGVGGGIIFVPVFREIVHLHPVEADKVPYILSNSLLIIFFVGISGTIKQYKIGNTNLKLAVITGLAAIASSLSISWILHYFKLTNQKVFNYIYASLLIFTATRMWMGRNKTKNEDVASLVLPDENKFIPAGFFAGIITALTGLGGGVIMVPYFNKILKLPIKFATGLSLTVIPVIAFPLLVFYMVNQPEVPVFEGLQTGFILWPAVMPMLIAASLASPLGIRAAHKMKSETVLTIFLIFILVNLVKILFF
jgi:uncharacterized membrane protein YfcA